VTQDVIDGSVTVTIHDGGEEILHDGRRLYAAETLRLTARDETPERAEMDGDVVYRWREHEASVEIRARSLQASTLTDFELFVDLEVDLDGEPFFRRRWDERIPRRLV
jgi:hypothetical protein